MIEDAKSDQAPVIETEQLRKVFGRKVAVDGLTLTVRRGEVFGFLGPNGAGKTTAIKMLMGLVHPTAGRARILGKPIGDLSVREQVGFLPEHFRFHDWLRADEFLDWHGELYGMPVEARAKRIPQVLGLVGLAEETKQKLRTFSKGMQQRIGIAQALMNSPSIVFLDEPTSALDPLGRRDVRDLIKRLRGEGVTVFLNSHLLSEVEMVCDRVVIIDHGRVIRQGTLDELLVSQYEIDVRVENLTPAIVEAVRPLAASVATYGDVLRVAVSDDRAIPAVAEAVIRAGGRLYELNHRRSSLEDLFVKAIEEEQRK